MSKFRVTVTTHREAVVDQVEMTFLRLKEALGAAMLASLAAGEPLGNVRWWQGGWANCQRKTWENNLRTIHIEVVRVPRPYS